MKKTMEMTIDNAIRYYEDKNVVLTEEEALANTVAINTMRKYEKIKEIMDELNGNFYGSYLKDRQTLEKIYEVVNNG